MSNGNGNPSNDYPPSIRVCRLYQRKSQKTGATFFTGRWGGAKLALVRSKETGDQGEPIWNLLLSEAPAPKQDDRPSAEAKGSSQAPPPRRHSDVGIDGPAPARGFDKQLDDEIPF
jgi:hypothetical protein